MGITKSAENKLMKTLIVGIVTIAAVIALLLVINSVSEGQFLTWTNARVILVHSIYPAFIAWGLCFVFACSYTDLSIGSIIVLGAFVTTILGNRFGLIGVIAGSVVTGTVLVVINYLVFVGTKIPSWIAGICLAMIYEAAATYMANTPPTQQLVSRELNTNLRIFGQFPMNVVILCIGMLVAYILYNKTTAGLNIRAVGGNSSVSKTLGINIIRTLIMVGVLSGIFLGIATLIQTSYTGRLTVKTGLTSLNLVFQPMAIVLLAQIMQSKINIIIAIPICSIIIFAIFNMLTMLGVPSGTLQELVLGIFVILFGIIGQKDEKGVVK